MQEYYKILGLTEDATIEEVELAYNTLRNKYLKDRFLEGEVGNRAAKKLTEVETAYSEIMNNKQERGETSKGSSLYEVGELIKKGDLNGAQSKLDEITSREAEWHYLQSIIFYKKNWVNESKKQLEIALQLDPHNSKYSQSYTKLKEKTEFSQARFHSGNFNGQESQTGRQMGGAGENDCCSFCTTWCCMNMLCNLCCNCR